ncbi:hypothetical protein [Streptococcus marimammalium]
MGKRELSIPTGNEKGANSHWIPAGQTDPGGVLEAVMKNVGIKEGDFIWHVVK